MRPLFNQYPVGFTPLFFTQILFNFGFYGFKSLFLLYAIDLLFLKESEAISFFSAFMSLTYATSLIGGTLADKLIGARSSLLMGGVLCCISIVVLSFSPESTIYVAMSLLSVGLGCFKPNFSTMLSMFFNDAQDPRKDSAFTTLYIAMNIGNFLGPIACSFISRAYGWKYGLFLIIISFVSGTLIILKRSHSFTGYSKKHNAYDIGKVFVILTLVSSIIYYLFRYHLYFHGLMGIIVAISIVSFCMIFYKTIFSERKGLKKAIFYILLFTFFCALYEQCGSSLLLFFDHFVDRQVLNLTLPPSSLLSLNPLLVLLLGVLIPFGAAKFSHKKVALEGLTKFSIGFFLTSLSFGILFLATYQGNQSISLLWMLFAILLQTIGELFIVPVGFSNISKLVPRSSLGFMMSLWLMAISYGHYLAGLMANYSLSSSEGIFIKTLENFSQFFLKLSIFPFIIAVFLAILMVVGTLKRKRAILKKA